MRVKITISDTPLYVDGEYRPAEPMTATDPGQPEEFEVDAVVTEKGDDITAVLDHFADRYAAFLPIQLRNRVSLWVEITEKALAAYKRDRDERELEMVMTRKEAA